MSLRGRAGSWVCNSARTASSRAASGEMRILEASRSCSAWESMSAASHLGLAEESARMAISLGPAIMSMPTCPTSRRLAVVTKMLPGPAMTSTRGMARVP